MGASTDAEAIHDFNPPRPGRTPPPPRPERTQVPQACLWEVSDEQIGARTREFNGMRVPARVDVAARPLWIIGISFEAQTGAGEGQTSARNAQIRTAAMLTEMLRSRYKIPGGNCVTHPQVSVNPSNMQIGYHVDWASSFPFERMGLPDNYATPSPAISLFGFAFDASFEQRAGVRLAGALEAERALIQGARSARLSPAAYRHALHRRYSKIMASHGG